MAPEGALALKEAPLVPYGEDQAASEPVPSASCSGLATEAAGSLAQAASERPEDKLLPPQAFNHLQVA